jgi:hypothetical protein
MLKIEDFKRISVKDVRKIIKELNLKQKNKELKGYSYKKKKDLINLISNMDIPESVLEKYRKPVKEKKTKAKPKKNITIDIADPENPTAGSDPMVKVDIDNNDMNNKKKYTIYHADNGEIKKGDSFNNMMEALKKFNELVKDNKSKVYLIEMMSNGNEEIIRSYVNPMINMKANGRFKEHMMYKGKKKEKVETKEEHEKLEAEGWKHTKPKHNSPKKKKAQMNKMESGY